MTCSASGSSRARYGSALDADLIETRARGLQAQQELLTTDLQRSDLQMQLNAVLGLPLTTPLRLDPHVSMPTDRQLELTKYR